jgi:hypothetical protein
LEGYSLNCESASIPIVKKHSNKSCGWS